MHEVGHATGHESRLGRPFGAPGGAAYAREELRAEIASAMMARKLGIGHDPAQHAAYADSWLKVLANDPHEIFRAARDAETINDWVLEPTRRPALEQAARDRQAAGARRERESGIMTDDRDTAARHYLRVPYEEKDAAKAAGARWDRKARAWYAPDGVERAPLAAWDTAAGRPAGSAGLAPEAEFAAACADRGLLIEGAPAMDGRWHRVQVEGDAKGQTGGSYRAWRDGRPAGQITNFRAGGTTKWIATGQALSAPDRAALQAEAAATRQDHAAARAKAHEGAARKAFGVWTNAAWAVETPYLRDKQVAAHGVKTDGDGGLIVPIHNIDGQLQSLQFIAADGAKRMLAGGRKTGGMHVIDPRGLLADKGSAAPLLVAEGYATAATLHETTGHPAVVAFDAGNLRAVAVALREKHPARDIVIAADDDRAKGNKSTLDQAEAAAKAAGAKVALPGFTDAERTHGRTDFNDLARAEPHRIQRALAAARHIKPGKAEDRARGIE